MSTLFCYSNMKVYKYVQNKLRRMEYIMAKITTKQELLFEAEKNYKELMDLIDSITEEEKHISFLFEDRDKNVRDVIAHLYHWHTLFNKWYDTAMVKMELPKIPEEGYNWRMLKELNYTIWEKYQDISLSEALDLLNTSHNQLLEVMKLHSEEELLQQGVYSWTKNGTLGEYCHANTGEHYVWAMTKIKKQVRLLKKSNKNQK